MFRNRQKRTWLLIASIAVGIALVLMLIPHGHSANSAAWLAILPILILWTLSFPAQPLFTACLRIGHPSEALTAPALFQRPPPSPLA